MEQRLGNSINETRQKKSTNKQITREIKVDTWNERGISYNELEIQDLEEEEAINVRRSHHREKIR